MVEFNLFKSIKDFIKVKNNDLSFLKVGDIVWAKRYSSEEEMESIPKGHRESPFIIIKQTRNKTYGLQCTSNPHPNIKWKHVYFPLGRLSYEFNKTSYVYTCKVFELNDFKYIKVMNHLSVTDLNNLYKSLYILIHSTFTYRPNLIDKDLKFKYDKGDIVKYKDKKYLIYDVTNKNYVCYPTVNKIKEKNKILINNTYYAFNFKNPKTIPIHSKLELKDWLNSGELEQVYNKRESIVSRAINNQKREVTVGTLIKVEDNFYYVYGEENNNFVSYKVYVTSTSPNNSILIIDHGLYYTELLVQFIKKTENYKIKRQASLEEIEHNKQLHAMSKNSRKKDRLVQIKNNKSKSFFSNENEIVPKSIVLNKYTNKYYLVLSKKNNILEIVNINDMKDYTEFEITEDNNPFILFRMASNKEFIMYRNKIDELMAIANSLY